MPLILLLLFRQFYSFDRLIKSFVNDYWTRMNQVFLFLLFQNQKKPHLNDKIRKLSLIKQRQIFVLHQWCCSTAFVFVLIGQIANSLATSSLFLLLLLVSWKDLSVWAPLNNHRLFADKYDDDDDDLFRSLDFLFLFLLLLSRVEETKSNEEQVRNYSSGAIIIGLIVEIEIMS